MHAESLQQGVFNPLGWQVPPVIFHWDTTGIAIFLRGRLDFFFFLLSLSPSSRFEFANRMKILGISLSPSAWLFLPSL